jgi:hypothetical protein
MRFFRVIVLAGLVLALGMLMAAQAFAQKPPAKRGFTRVFPNMQHVFVTLPRDMQDELMAEAERAQAICEMNPIFASFQDCECIKYKFLDARLATGPDDSTHNLLEEVSRECPNKPGIAGHQYKQCMETMPYVSVATKEEADEFCGCVGNKVAEAYARAPANSMRYQIKLAAQAQIDCDLRNLVTKSEIEYQKNKAREANVLP